ncbi:MAG: phenylacetic acid degradation bifunctional protein PaaZ [Bacteroidetes bacterium]|nr:phenylacetic acid degradation bifunctional protein PaaZ [Bacteroidota bacterium]
MIIQNYALDEWVIGKTVGQDLIDASTGEIFANTSSDGLDFGEMMKYARNTGSPALRKLTFYERGNMLKALAFHLQSKKEKFYEISYKTGATRIDSWIDIEGGIGNLFSYASLRRKFSDKPFHVEGEALTLSKNGTFSGHHLLVPKEGLALHINAFNFPVWGMLEKIAVNLLAGVPAIVKPATVTSFLTFVVFKEIIDSKILPAGSLQLICGSANGILEHLTFQDVVTFTGSAETGKKLKSHPKIIEESIPFNLEADSLNCMVLGEDAHPKTEEFSIFINEVKREIIVKAGQKCTAVRRIIVPEKFVEDVSKSLSTALSKVKIGDPRTEGVKMGPLASTTQRNEVFKNLEILLKESEIIFDKQNCDFDDNIDIDKGSFVSPVILLNKNPFKNKKTHEIEVFGPVSTIIPYKNLNEAIELSKMGKGSLCSSITTANDAIAKDFVLATASHHGRIVIFNKNCIKESTGHGSPLPNLVHGGPGRAGGGEEMGGIRGVMHYMQRTAIQGSPTTLTEITEIFQPGSEYKTPEIHLFRKHFEELVVGESITTHKRTITESDIVNFANVSWDHFYAHTDATSLEGTMFTQRVAHGYFVLSAAAGLFVDPAKGPVLLNYGLDECRFTKPVYPGSTIYVKLTVKEKVNQQKKNDEDIAKGIVKYYVEVFDETNEHVAIATILTMVKKINQNEI